jgi:outer membrane receptor for monomeric catechols
MELSRRSERLRPSPRLSTSHSTRRHTVLSRLLGDDTALRLAASSTASAERHAGNEVQSVQRWPIAPQSDGSLTPVQP